MEITFTKEALNAAQRAIERVDKCMNDMDSFIAVGEDSAPEGGATLEETCEREGGKFYAAIADDLSTPRAAAR